MFMGLYILQVGGMFTAAQIVTQGTITWPKMLNSIVIKRAFQMLFGGFLDALASLKTMFKIK